MLGQDRQIGTLVVFMRDNFDIFFFFELDNFDILKGENGLRLLAYIGVRGLDFTIESQSIFDPLFYRL